MAKATAMKDAIAKWLEAHPEKKVDEVLDIGLQFQWPPIDKMDSSLGALKKCQKLSLSSNVIDKIAGINTLKNLKILSIGRNYLKTFAGLDALADTLEQLWISYNLIEKTRGIDNLKKLKVLYISNNLVKNWGEFDRFASLPMLEDFLFTGNPLYESMDYAKYYAAVLKKMPNLKVLEGETVVGADEDEDD